MGGIVLVKNRYFFIFLVFTLLGLALYSHAAVPTWAASEPEATAAETRDRARISVTFDLDNVFVEVALKALARSADLNLIIESPVDRAVTLKFKDTPAEDALRAIAKRAEVSVRELDNIYIFTRKSAEITLENLVGSDAHVTLNANSEEVSALLAAIAKISKLHIILERDVSARVTVLLKEVKAGVAIELISKTCGFKVSKAGDVYTIGK
jgi:type II secretory pathway component HofQ